MIARCHLLSLYFASNGNKHEWKYSACQLNQLGLVIDTDVARVFPVGVVKMPQQHTAPTSLYS
jgi:hypothetical protein